MFEKRKVGTAQTPLPTLRTDDLRRHSGARAWREPGISGDQPLDSGSTLSASPGMTVDRSRRLGLEMAEHDVARLVVHFGLEHELVLQRDRARRGRPCRDL